MFVNTLASNDNGGFIWVKVSRATVEEQLAARPESCNVNGSKSEVYVACSICVTGGKRIKVLGDVDIGAVDVEPIQFHCSSKVLIPRNIVGDSMTVGPVLDSGSGITCLSERLAQKMEQHFRGERLIHPSVWEGDVC